MAIPGDIAIRLVQPADRSGVLNLAPRLTEGVARWRDPAAVRAAVHGWVQDSLDSAGDSGHAVFVAVAGNSVVGVVTVCERTHFTGQVDAYVGELAVATGWERQGIASRLMTAAEMWGAERGLSHLTLETGAANQPARQFYAALGYIEEDVRLTKAIRPGGQGGQPTGAES
jgi:ribosomal protein S18 acetylase RimI-like enzyme